MIPIVEVPETISSQMKNYRDVFCRNEGFDHVKGKHWVSEIECSRNINWSGEWQRVDSIAKTLRREHPESFRHIKVKCRNGEIKDYWVTKQVRLKRYGHKRLAIVHETEDLTDTPSYYLTDALHWEGGRILET